MEKNTDNMHDLYSAINRIWGFNFSAAEKYFNTDSAESPIQSYYYGEVIKSIY